MHTLLLCDTTRCLQVRANKRSICFLTLPCKRTLDIRVRVHPTARGIRIERAFLLSLFEHLSYLFHLRAQPGWGWLLVMVYTQQWGIELSFVPTLQKWPIMCPVSVLDHSSKLVLLHFILISLNLFEMKAMICVSSNKSLKPLVQSLHASFHLSFCCNVIFVLLSSVYTFICTTRPLVLGHLNVLIKSFL